MKKFGFILILIVSEVLGIALGELNYRFFMKTVPPLAMTSIMSGTAHAAYLTYGAIAGIVIFLWTLIAGLLMKMFMRSGSGAARTAAA